MGRDESKEMEKEKEKERSPLEFVSNHQESNESVQLSRVSVLNLLVQMDRNQPTIPIPSAYSYPTAPPTPSAP